MSFYTLFSQFNFQSSKFKLLISTYVIKSSQKTKQVLNPSLYEIIDPSKVVGDHVRPKGLTIHYRGVRSNRRSVSTTSWLNWNLPIAVSVISAWQWIIFTSLMVAARNQQIGVMKLITCH